VAGIAIVLEGAAKNSAGGFIYRAHDRYSSISDYTVQLFSRCARRSLEVSARLAELTKVRAGVWVDDDSLLVQSPSARSFEQITTRDVQVEMHPRRW